MKSRTSYPSGLCHANFDLENRRKHRFTQTHLADAGTPFIESTNGPRGGGVNKMEAGNTTSLSALSFSIIDTLGVRHQKGDVRGQQSPVISSPRHQAVTMGKGRGGRTIYTTVAVFSVKAKPKSVAPPPRAKTGGGGHCTRESGVSFQAATCSGFFGARQTPPRPPPRDSLFPR